MVLVLLLTCLLGLVGQGSAQCDDFRLASYYDSHMVLQKAPVSAALWGYATNAGDIITVDFNGDQQEVTAYIGDEGVPVWSASLPATEAGGPYDISITSNGCTIDIDDVLFGDVYICSGQSNMEMTFAEIDNPDDDIEDVVNYQDVRTFQGARFSSDEPLYDLGAITRTWAVPTPENMPSFSAVCWLFGRNLYRQLGYPLGLVQTCWGGTRIETWSSPEALDECFEDEGPPDQDTPNSVSQLWNGMIHPYLPMSIFGAIWYQGEQNSGREDDYTCSLPAMINDWRAKWNDATNGETDLLFPFGQVQLAPWERTGNETGFPELRWAQTTKVGFTPNDDLVQVYTAVAVDLPDFDSPSGSIHPRYKRQISYRLSLGAFDVAYGLGETTGRYHGPFPTDIYWQNSTSQVIIEYDHLETELNTLRRGTGFELCCAEEDTFLCPSEGARWEHALITETVHSTARIVAVCGADEYITGIRYIWRESPCDLEVCALYSVENDLPAPPFRVHGLLKQK